MALWVEDVNYSQATAEKLEDKHQLAVDEVYDAVVQVEGLRYRWHEDPVRGLRALVRGSS